MPLIKMDVKKKYEITEHKLFAPSLEEVSNLFNDKLKNYFKNVSVCVEECPDLKSEPFNLVQTGLCGNPVVVDIGGVPNLIPIAKVDDDSYHLPSIISQIGYKDGSIFGASGGNHKLFNTNCEGFTGLTVAGDEITNKSFLSIIDPKDDRGHKLVKISGTDAESVSVTLLGNLFLSDGKPGKVIKINARSRLDKQDMNRNFITNLRHILSDRYGHETLSLGGFFLIKNSKVKVHVVPEFSQTPLETDAQVKNWLKYFLLDSPLICMSVFHSNDNLNLDVRIEHSHCYNEDTGTGGHYHGDIEDDVEYEGYFMIAEKIYRVDKPALKSTILKD